MLLITLIQLAIGILLFAALSAYLLIKIPKSYRLKFLLIPAIFALALYMGITIPQLLGYAYPGQPTGDFVYLNHIIKEGKKITLMVKENNGSIRLFTFNGDEATLRLLAQANAMTKQGEVVIGNFKGNENMAFPGLQGDLGKLSIHSPKIQGMLPPKDERSPTSSQ